MKEISLSLRNKKAIVFDLDGTIVDLKVNWLHLKQLLSERFLKIYGEFNKFKLISECLNRIVMREDEEELLKVFQIIENYELKNIEYNDPIEETIFFINNLELFGVKNGVILSVLSLNMQNTIIESLKLIDLHDKFKYLVGRDNVRHWKPNPEGLIKIRDHFGLNNDDMIYIGDMDNDVLTGKNAGMDAYLIDDLIQYVRLKFIR